MSIYLIPIQAAILIFPLLSAVITIPYIIVQYRRYGSLLPLRIAIVYSFIFYMLCAYFMVILPLPPIEEVAQYTSPTMQLIPFESLREFSVSTSLVITDPSTYLKAFNEPSLFLIVFNILLTVPFGIYLHYYFKCSWKKTLLFSFLLTLSFECIQLSALFGLYPRPYRLFDVDDLITNTIGGMLGYAITPLFAHFLPSRERLDEMAYSKGQQVSSLRRCFAFFIDLFIVSILSLITVIILIIANMISLTSLSTNILYIYSFYVILCVILLSIITKGKTIGKALVNIRLVQKENHSLKWYQHILHYGILYLIILPCPYIIFLTLMHYLDIKGFLSYDLAIISILSIFYIFALMQQIKALFIKDKYTWFDVKDSIHNISTIILENEEEA